MTSKNIKVEDIHAFLLENNGDEEFSLNSCFDKEDER